jgi:hypothetical protein
MAHTDALGEFIQKLHTDTDLQEKYETDPAAALEGYEVTHHEHDAVATKDHDDLVAIGVAASIEDLPPIMGGGDDCDDPEPELPYHLRARLEAIEANIQHLLEHTTPQPKLPVPPRPGPWMGG